MCRAKGGIGSGETLWHDIYPATTTLIFCQISPHSVLITSYVRSLKNLQVKLGECLSKQSDWYT